MKRTFILCGTFFLVLAVISCNNSKQQKRNENAGSGKANTIIKQIANTSAQIYAKPQIPVICYHRIALDRISEYEVTPSTFEAQLKMLADSGYHSISPAQLYDYLVYNKSLPGNPIMITFDDSREEHFRIAAPVLEKYGFRGVFFIMTITLNKKNYMTENQIAQLAKDGHSIGLHSWDHTMVTKYKDADDWKKQVEEPKRRLEKMVERPVEYWAYPDGVYNSRSADELRKYFKLSFILVTKRDSIEPLETVRRMIAQERTPQNLLKIMHRTFSEHK
jgi:peptidoglycan/xylan/chitin deacetylase (PgdA/CDA1 family)